MTGTGRRESIARSTEKQSEEHRTKATAKETPRGISQGQGYPETSYRGAYARWKSGDKTRRPEASAQRQANDQGDQRRASERPTERPGAANARKATPDNTQAVGEKGTGQTEAAQKQSGMGEQTRGKGEHGPARTGVKRGENDEGTGAYEQNR